MTTHVDLRQVRMNALAIRAATGKSLIGVVKADAYGLGAVAVADTLQDLVDCWYVFAATEAKRYRLWDLTGKPTICAVALDSDPPETLRREHVRPGVWTIDQVRRFRDLDPVLSVDTGMQRFACPVERIVELRKAHRFSEAYTHASRPEQARALHELFGDSGMKLHAAGSALLANPDCWLDCVRPGLALYRDAVRVSLPLADARESRGAIGYTQFTTRHHGVILKGYSDGMRAGACIINGRRQQVIEVGMQSAFVTLDPADRAGDEVCVLGGGLSLEEAAAACKSTPHETLYRLSSMGDHAYDPPVPMR